MSTHEDPNSHSNEDIRFEPTDVATRPVALSVLGLAIFTVLFTFVAHLVFHGLAARQAAESPPASPLAAQYAAKQPPEPRLQVNPRQDLVSFRAAEAKTLGRLAWVDRDAGVVQVPIERAMEILLARGLPARDAPVPWKMAPQGVAPSQRAEAAGAPDWYWGTESGTGKVEYHGTGTGTASHEAAPQGHAH